MSADLLARMKFGAVFWNHWREEHPDAAIVLDHARLDGMILTGINLSRASLRHASLHATNLMNADLRYADLTGDDLKDALHIPIVARVSHRFNVPADRIYDAFLDLSTLRRFLYASASGEIVRAELDPRVGGTYVLIDRRNGADVEHTGRYLELDRPRRIVFTMFVPGYSVSADRVAVQIQPDLDGCALALTHAMRPEFAPYVPATVDAYREHLRTLESILA